MSEVLAELELPTMRWWDIPAVHEIEQVVFPRDKWTEAQFWSELAGVPDSRYYVTARFRGRLVGYAGLFAVGDEADVQTIAVAPQARGRGIGGALLGELVAAARQRGARRLCLEVRSDNQAAIGLYERAGFRVDGRRRDYYGPGQAATLMSLEVPE